MKRLLFLVSEDVYFCSHRLNLAKAALNSGFKVAVATKCNKHIEDIQKAGIDVFPLKKFSRAGLNPFRQLQSVFELYQIYQTFKPDIVHHVAIKPIILGSCVARFCRVPKIINALGGLGFLFTDPSPKALQFKRVLLRKIACYFFRHIFAQTHSHLILQNQDDFNTLYNAKCITSSNVSIIRGAGINPNDFPVRHFPPKPPILIACVSRMLWDKGIGELVEASRILQQKKCPLQIVLYGTPDEENPTSINSKQLEAWHNSGIIHWKGQCNDVATAYANCHIAILPSYREGLPKTLLEAASCGRPIITTDVPGCREVVQPGINGLLIPAKNSVALANAILALCENEQLCIEMGKKGRDIVENYFTDSIIHQQTLSLYDN